MLFIVSIFANEDTNITWESLGIGIHNKGEITDWTYYCVKTPKEASLWIDALKPLGRVSYSAVACIWKDNGYTVNEAKEWIAIGVKNPLSVKYWVDVGIDNVQEVKKWKNLGLDDPWYCKEWIDAGFLVDDVAKALSEGYKSPLEVNRVQKKQKEESIEQNSYDEVITLPESNTEEININQVRDSGFLENSEYQKDKNGYQVFLLVYFVLMIITIFKGAGENRTVVIFRDYNDLGLTFLIPVSFMLISYLFMMFEGKSAWGVGLALIVSIVLFWMVVKSTYYDNNKKFIPTILALITKVPLGIIWIFSFITMLNPSGKTAKQRRKNRASALMLMAILTPIISMLIVEKKGSLFNPRDWIKGRRIGSIRKYL